MVGAFYTTQGVQDIRLGTADEASHIAATHRANPATQTCVTKYEFPHEPRGAGGSTTRNPGVHRGGPALTNPVHRVAAGTNIFM